MCDVGGAAGGEGAAGCNDKNKNPTIECGEKQHLPRTKERSAHVRGTSLVCAGSGGLKLNENARF